MSIAWLTSYSLMAYAWPVVVIAQIACVIHVLHQYRRGTVVWRFQEQPWYQAAKRLRRQ